MIRCLLTKLDRLIQKLHLVINYNKLCGISVCKGKHDWRPHRLYSWDNFSNTRMCQRCLRVETFNDETNKYEAFIFTEVGVDPEWLKAYKEDRL